MLGLPQPRLISVALVLLADSLSALGLEEWINVKAVPKSYFSVSTPNVLRCGNLCQRQGKCAAVTFDYRNRMCHMHDIDVPVDETNSGYYFFKKYLANTQKHRKSSCDRDTQIAVPTADQRDGMCYDIKGCPRHLLERGYIYNASVYLCWEVSGIKVTADQARKDCESDDGHLLVMDSAYHDAVMSYLRSQGNRKVFVDGNLDTTSGQWYSWDKKPLSWIPWADTEPNGGFRETCIVIDHYRGTDKVADYPCSTTHYYACQVDND